MTLNDAEVRRPMSLERKTICMCMVTHGVIFSQVNAIERDALQVLSLVRSTKNALSLVNRVPPDVLAMIPTYWEDSEGDMGLIRLTHVCRSWRETIMSRPLLWTRLDCTSVGKTKLYIERSKSCPLEICIRPARNAFYREQAFILAIQHIDRLRTLSVSGNPREVLPVLVKHFSRRVPLLNVLNINLVYPASIPPSSLFDGDLSSLRELSLTRVIMPLPWSDLSSLTTFNFCHVPKDVILLSQLLDFFESVPRLRHIRLHNSIPNSSDAPTERVVFLPRLKDLSIIAQPPHSILLNHLSVPVGALLRLEFTFSSGESPIPSYSPKSLENLENLSHITATNLFFGLERRSVWLNGPSGGLYIFGNRTQGGSQPNIGITRFLRSLLDQFDISRSQRLAITLCHYRPRNSAEIETWSVYQTLHSMEDLRTLTLARCINRPFILTLNPRKNSSKTVLCPKLEELTLYIKNPGQYRINELLSMVKERASRGAKLSAISIISLENAFLLAVEMSQLREHVARVEYRVGDVMPAWDAL